MKKMFSILFLTILTLLISPCTSPNYAEAADNWVHTDQATGKTTYVVYESVVYGYYTDFYARAMIKQVNSKGQLIINQTWEFNDDEGDWWYGVKGQRITKRVYDYPDVAAVLEWLKAHRNEAHNTGNPTQKVLR